MKRFSIPSFVSGVMLGVLLAGAYFIKSDDAAVFTLPELSAPFRSSSGEMGGRATFPTAAGSGAVSVLDQSSGDVAVVESVTVPPPGVWVAVREVQGEALGNVLGATRVDGPKSGVTISLLRATEPGRPYAVQLYRDDGNGLFDTAADSVYVDFDTGAPVIAFFTTTP